MDQFQTWRRLKCSENMFSWLFLFCGVISDTSIHGISKFFVFQNMGLSTFTKLSPAWVNSGRPSGREKSKHSVCSRFLRASSMSEAQILIYPASKLLEIAFWMVFQNFLPRESIPVILATGESKNTVYVRLFYEPVACRRLKFWSIQLQSCWKLRSDWFSKAWSGVSQFRSF